MTARIQTTLSGGIAAALASIFLPAATSANPDGGEVIAGDVKIDGGPGRLDVSQRGDKAIIHWQSFDVATGEQTHFQQPSVDSVTLNRVVAGGVSRIDGLVTAPGKVFLVNPSGMIFGPNAQVGVNSLVATTADLANEDFLAGSYKFSIPSQDPDVAVVNRGAIEAAEGGAVVLAAPEVRNEGVVVASLGTIELAGTDRFVLDFAGDGLLSFDIGAAGPDAIPSDGRNRVVQQGRVEADGGIVVLSARAADALVDRAINMTGVIEARSVGQEDGAIILSGGAGTVGVEGTLDVSGADPGERGGHIEISGARVGLFDGTRIRADGRKGGGTVHVGSHAPAHDPSAGTRRSYLGVDTVVAADATADGDGGEVIVWAEETTRFYGAVSARGAGAGDGGFVEVSAKSGLTFDGTADVGADAPGAVGNVLLDPDNIVICAFPGCSRVVTGDVFADQDPGTNYSISAQSLESLTGNITLQARDNISIQSPLTLMNMGAGASLALQAGNDVSFLGFVSITTAGGDLILEADAPALNADGSGVLSVLQGGAELNSNGGDITLVAADLDLDDINVDAGAGDIHIATSLPTQAVSMNALDGLQSLSTQGTLTLTAGSVFTDTAGISSDAAATVIEVTGDILLNSEPLTMNGGSLSLRGQTVLLNQVDTGGGDFDVAANNLLLPQVTGGVTTGGGDVAVNVDGAFATNGAIATGGGDFDVVADAFTAAAVDVGAGDVSMRAGSLSFGLLFGQGTLTLEPSSPTTPIAIGAGVTPVAGAFVVDAALLNGQPGAAPPGFGQLIVGRIDGAHAIEIGDIAFPLPVAVAIRSPVGGGIDITGDATVGPSLTLTAPNVSVSTGSVAVQGTLDVSATGDVIATGPVAVTAGISRVAAGGTIALTNPANTFAGPLSLVASGGDVTVVTQGPLSLGASELGSGQVLLLAGDLQVAGPVPGTANLVLRPFDVNDSIGIGDVNAAFSLSNAELALFSGALGSITVGGPNQIGELLVAGAEAGVPLTLQVDPAAGAISVLGDLTGIDDAAFTFSGPVRLGANIVTDGGSIRFLSSVTLTGDVRLDAAGAGDILFAGALNGATNTLTVGGGLVSNDPSIPLTLGSLVIEELAGGADVAGSVDGATGRAAAARVQLLGGIDANYLINGCVMGVDCEQLPNTTLLSIPAVPPAAETVQRAATNTLAVWERPGASPDPRDAVYSNLGNEELWSADPGEGDE